MFFLHKNFLVVTGHVLTLGKSITNKFSSPKHTKAQEMSYRALHFYIVD